MHGLPREHILLWMFDKTRPDHIDSIIFVEVPDRETDPERHSVVTTNMTHGPCRAHNSDSSSMEKINCTKRFLRLLVADKISGINGYSLYLHRSFLTADRDKSEWKRCR